MKKTYILGMALLAGSMSFAQANKALVKKAADLSVKATTNIRPTLQNQDRTTVLWSDQCSDISTWTVTNSSTNNEEWSLETNSDLQAITLTNLAASLSPFASTSVADGFLMINSDAAAGNGEQNSTPIVTSATTNTTIDLTGNPQVVLRFQHNYRWWHENRRVRVSGDGGANFTTFEITGTANGEFDLANGFGSGEQNSNNPQQEFIDISSIAGGQSDVQIQFVYDDNDFWGWYWAIDDVDIVVKEDNDLTATANYLGTFGPFGNNLPYHSTPIAQVQPIVNSAFLKNVGVLDQTGAKVSFDVNGTTETTATGLDIPVNDTVLVEVSYTPTAIGEYIFSNITFSADVVDDNLLNNFLANDDTIDVVEYLYARDNGYIQSNGYSNVDATTSAVDGYQLGNIYDVFADQELFAISFVPHSNSVVGAKVSVVLYEVNNSDPEATLADRIVDVAKSDLTSPYELTQDDITSGNQIDIKFKNGTHLVEAGKTYLAVVNAQEDMSGVTTAQLVTGLAGNSQAGTSFMKDFGDDTWYYVTSTPMVRMNFDISLGLNDSKNLVSSLNAFPNPANENVNINFTITEASNVSVSVVSVTGDIVYNNSLGSISAGNYSENVNASKLANGVYFYTLSVNGNVTTKKLVISKK